MTDKQIIDGERIFKCVWCKYDFRESDANFILSENPNECVCSGCITEWADNLLWDFKRKEQECEELKHKIELMMDCAKGQAEQKLERIKELATALCYTVMSDGVVILQKDILQIIDEVENER